MGEPEGWKPPLTIDLIAPEGNVFAIVGKACAILEGWGLPDQATALRTWFGALHQQQGVSYDDVRRKVEEFCEVTWLHDTRAPAEGRVMSADDHQVPGVE